MDATNFTKCNAKITRIAKNRNFRNLTEGKIVKIVVVFNPGEYKWSFLEKNRQMYMCRHVPVGSKNFISAQWLAASDNNAL